MIRVKGQQSYEYGGSWWVVCGLTASFLYLVVIVVII